MRGALTPELEAVLAASEETEGLCLNCDPNLVEASVFAAVRGTPIERDFQLRRETCYSVPEMEARDRAFAALNYEWFARLRLAEPVLTALGEHPNIPARTARCILAPAIRRQDECAELYGPTTDPSAGRPYLVMRIRPESLGNGDYVMALLRHELMHIEDILDPTFAYDPSPAQFLDAEGVPTLIRDRYQVLWDTYIDGRLHRQGPARAVAHEARSAEFARAFKSLKSHAAAGLFESVFNAARLTHRDLIALSRNPQAFDDTQSSGLVRLAPRLAESV